jgi:hypothetical protein
MAAMPEANLTLAAFHGAQKPEPLRKLLSDVQSALGVSSCGFEAYAMGQMHATLIVMEADVVEGRLYGHWFRKNRQELREISVDRLHRIVSERVGGGGPLFTIRFGGFPECYCTCRTKGRDARDPWLCATAAPELGAFHSCDRTAYEGSFYAVAPGPAIITGWPVDEPSSFTHGLYEFRRSLEQAGLADKYHYDTQHEKAHWKNDDCFIRIGTFREPIPIRDTQQRMRTFFSNMEPVLIDIAPADVSIVQYTNPSLREQDILARIPLPTFVNDPSSLKLIHDSSYVKP